MSATKALPWAAVSIVSLVFGTMMVRLSQPNENTPTDFYQDYASARNVLTRNSVYRPIEGPFREGTERSAQPGKLVLNAHPPASVLLVLPFAFGSYESAAMAWNVASVAALAAAVIAISRTVKLGLSGFDYMAWPIVLTVWPPLWIHLVQGQFGLILLLLVALVWANARRGHEGRAGCFLGVAAAIKIFPVLLIAFFVIRRRWRAVAASIVALLAVNLLAAALLGVHAYREYAAVLPTLSRFRTFGVNSSVIGFASKLANSPTSLLIVATGGLLVTALWLKAARTDFDAGFSISITAILLLSPLTWQHSFVLLLLPLLVCARQFSQAPAAVRILVIASWIFMSIPQQLVVEGSNNPVAVGARSLGLLSLNFYGLLGFLLAQHALRHREPLPNVRASLPGGPL